MKIIYVPMPIRTVRSGTFQVRMLSRIETPTASEIRNHSPDGSIPLEASAAILCASPSEMWRLVTFTE